MMELQLTERAIAKIADLLSEQADPLTKLRAFVQGGGCSGFSYGFSFDQEQAEDDFVIQRPGITVLVDSMSMQYLAGATVDYKEELMGSSFVVNNPNAQSTCGCGSSFAI